jgi:hypothetical protein
LEVLGLSSAAARPVPSARCLPTIAVRIPCHRGSSCPHSRLFRASLPRSPLLSVGRRQGEAVARRPAGSSGLLTSRGHQRKTHPQVPPTGQSIARGSRWRCCRWGGSWAAPLGRVWGTYSHRVPPRERPRGPGPDSAAIARFLKARRITTSAQEPRSRRWRETSSCTVMVHRTAT